MNAQRFPAHLNRLARQLEQYALNVFPGMAVNKTLRFINGNFRAQGWQGQSFKRWPKNKRGTTILVRRGALRRSPRGQTAPGMARVWSDSPYAAIHNRGFKGTVQVKQHERRRFAAQRTGTGRFNKNGTERKKTIHVQTGTSTVQAHARKMNIPQRQFMPEKWNDSPVLVNAIRREVVKTFKSIFNT